MRKLLTTKFAILGLIVAALALAAGAAAKVGTFGHGSGPARDPQVSHFTTDRSTAAPDVQDEVVDVEDQSDSGPAADPPDTNSDDQGENADGQGQNQDDQADVSQPAADQGDQGDQGENADDQGDSNDQGDQATSEDDQGGPQADDQGDSNDQGDSSDSGSGDGQDDGNGDN
jgi:hypothetical protein